jgi:hypothetical protein
MFFKATIGIVLLSQLVINVMCICDPACFNGGIADANGACSCPSNFNGSRCQFPQPTPNAVDDAAFCSNVNCWDATEQEFYSCPRKCMWCQNKQCNNLGKLNDQCQCVCVNSMYDPADSCNLIAANCGNHPACFSQFKAPGSCASSEFVRVMCPLACGVCALSG